MWGEVDTVYLDFSKAFDMFTLSLLLERMVQRDPDVRDLADRLHPEGCDEQLLFKLELTRSGVPQGSLWVPTLFKILTSDLDNGINCTLIKFVNDITLTGEVETSEQIMTQQEDMDSGIMQDRDIGRVLTKTS